MNSLKTEILKVEIKPKGAPLFVDAVRADNKTFIIKGKILKTASLKDEWHNDVDHPQEVIHALRDGPVRIDLLKFWQRIPETEPKFPYYKEWRQVAAIPITDFKQWWDKQINCKTRNMVRKSHKLGVTIEQIELNDEFIRGVVDIYNQSPVRRGKPFRHYGKDFTTAKAELSVDLAEAMLVVAYYAKELIGFIKFVVTDRYAIITMILDKTSHRDKAPMNGMIAKVVEICATRNIPYLVYTTWRRGDHGNFQKYNGFVKVPVPEYYVPITVRGRLALRLGLHKGIKGAIPEKVMIRLLALRARWYNSTIAQQILSHFRSSKAVTLPAS